MPYDRIPECCPTLRCEGLELRELTEADLPAWLDHLSDPEAAGLAGDPVAPWMGSPRHDAC